MDLALQTTDGSHHRHITVDPFIHNVLNDEAYLFRDVVVRTDELVYLVQLSVSLSQVQTATFQHSIVLFIGDSLEVVLSLSEELKNDLVGRIYPPLWLNQEPVFSCFQVLREINGFFLVVLSADPPKAMASFSLQQDEPAPDILSEILLQMVKPFLSLPESNGELRRFLYFEDSDRRMISLEVALGQFFSCSWSAFPDDCSA